MKNEPKKITQANVKYICKRFKELFKIYPTGVFYNILPIYTGIDIPEFKRYLSKIDPEYDHINCTYKEKNMSMREYIALKYGHEADEIVRSLIFAKEINNMWIIKCVDHLEKGGR